jgi:hypothetical protein
MAESPEMRLKATSTDGALQVAPGISRPTPVINLPPSAGKD